MVDTSLPLVLFLIVCITLSPSREMVIVTTSPADMVPLYPLNEFFPSDSVELFDISCTTSLELFLTPVVTAFTRSAPVADARLKSPTMTAFLSLLPQESINTSTDNVLLSLVNGNAYIPRPLVATFWAGKDVVLLRVIFCPTLVGSSVPLSKLYACGTAFAALVLTALSGTVGWSLVTTISST